MLKTQLMQEKTQVLLAAQEDKVWEGLFGATMNIQNAIAKARADTDAYKLEREALRPLALQMQDFFLRKHLLLTKPYFPTRAVTPEPNAVFFCGDADLRQLVAQICQTQRLSLQAETASANPAQQRWDQLRTAAVAIFDMRRYSREATYTNDPPAARQVAAAAYELGIAFAIGKPVVVVAKPNQALPFDVDIEPVRLSGAVNDLDLLTAAIESALYGRQRGGEEGSIAVTIDSLLRLYGNSANSYVRTTVATLDANAASDAIKVRQITAQVIRFIGTEAPWMIFPAWPGDYPQAQGRFCFHVTAFEGSDRPWPKWTKEIVQSECPRGIVYKRGDQSDERDIIRAIWHDICRAWYVVADISDLNPNAVMELGMAHVLGRKVLLITKDSNMSFYPDTIAKERKVVYTLTDTNDSPELRTALRKFFAS
jgi:nucleoside 2-deoxyribosyltransferase